MLNPQFLKALRDAPAAVPLTEEQLAEVTRQYEAMKEREAIEADRLAKDQARLQAMVNEVTAAIADKGKPIRIVPTVNVGVRMSGSPVGAANWTSLD
jgi:hypothetical protein